MRTGICGTFSSSDSEIDSVSSSDDVSEDLTFSSSERNSSCDKMNGFKR